MFTVLDIKKQLQDLTGYDHTETSVSDRFMRFINNTRLELSKLNEWDFLKKTFYLRTLPDITAGTISVTKGSFTVTGSSTAFTSVDTNWYMALGGIYYRVASVLDDSTLSLQSPYVGPDLSGSTYTLRKIFYRVPADIRKLSSMYQFVVPDTIPMAQGDFARNNPCFNSITGTPVKYDVCGLYGLNKLLVDSADAVSDSVAGTTTTYGNGLSSATTSFQTSGIIPGDYATSYDTIDPTKYYVSSVDSEGSLTSYNKFALPSILAGYKIYSNPDSMLIRFYPTNGTETVIPFEYYHYSFPLAIGDDTDEFIRRYPELVVEGSLVWEKRASDDMSWSNDYTKWKNSIRETIGSRKSPIVTPRTMYKYEAY